MKENDKNNDKNDNEKNEKNDNKRNDNELNKNVKNIIIYMCNIETLKQNEDSDDYKNLSTLASTFEFLKDHYGFATALILKAYNSMNTNGLLKLYIAHRLETGGYDWLIKNDKSEILGFISISKLYRKLDNTIYTMDNSILIEGYVKREYLNDIRIPLMKELKYCSYIKDKKFIIIYSDANIMSLFKTSFICEQKIEFDLKICKMTRQLKFYNIYLDD